MFTDQELRLIAGLSVCGAILGMIYLTAWMCEKRGPRD